MNMPFPLTPLSRDTDTERALRADNDATPLPALVATWLARNDFPHPLSRSVNGLTPLMLAVRQDDHAVMNALIALGLQIYAVDDAGNNALWYASTGGSPASIVRLVDAGIDIDHANDDGITCLMQAAANGRTEVMRLLIAQGANVTLCAPDGRSAMDILADRDRDLPCATLPVDRRQMPHLGLMLSASRLSACRSANDSSFYTGASKDHEFCARPTRRPTVKPFR
ncbi:ankyrin repeat domain-containing protein [Trinickia symbiotica]|uniref:Ankyrin repeat domain-containing protein n=2 Tax=Trinickia symbiotica TaxID=863227 RepID=A0A2T3XL67_9BURK|nr:ankyrin repeat domain-containing protein [Trinickia symbiotica]